MSKKDTGIVNIHGKQYKTVAARVNDFRSIHKHDLSIVTELVSATDKMVVMKASIINPSGFVIATGYAEEVRGSTNINKTSSLENCETSAIGRCLAAFGLAGTEYASADEVANAINQQKEITEAERLHAIEQAQRKELFAELGQAVKHFGYDAVQALQFAVDTIKRDLDSAKDMTNTELNAVIAAFKTIHSNEQEQQNG